MSSEPSTLEQFGNPDVEKTFGHILIVGGDGKLGRVLQILFLDNESQVSIFDPKEGSEDGEPFATADLIFMSVPPGAPMVEAHQQLLDRVRGRDKPPLVVEVCSFQGYPKSIVEEWSTEDGPVPPVIFLHPMFGPGTFTSNDEVNDRINDRGGIVFDGLVVVGSQGFATQEDFAAIKKLFEDKGINVHEMEPAEHDELMSRTQFLAHLTKWLTVDVIGNGADNFDFASVFDALSQIQVPRSLFKAMLKFNRFAKEVLNDLKSNLESDSSEVEEEDHELDPEIFTEIFKKVLANLLLETGKMQQSELVPPSAKNLYNELATVNDLPGNYTEQDLRMMKKRILRQIEIYLEQPEP